MAASDNDGQGRLTTLQKLSLTRVPLACRRGRRRNSRCQHRSSRCCCSRSSAAGRRQAAAPTPPTGTIPVTLKVNGVAHRVQIDPRATVLDTLRETLHLTGTKKGCDHGQCGACTVHVNGLRANSCLLFAAMQQKAEITTIEGLGTPDEMHPVQAAFVEHDGYQCGYCTSGQIMSTAAMLKEPWGPADADVREGHERQHLPLRRLPEHCCCRQACRKRTA